MASKPEPAAVSAHEALYAELFAASQGARYGLLQREFRAALEAICARYLSTAGEDERRDFLRGLRLQELALARACACGHEPAWTEFLNRYRAGLYQAAYAIAGNEAAGRELADSLYAELWGMKSDGSAQTRSKLEHYSGRGSLEGWLRTVLAQEHVNRFRKTRKLVSLEEQCEAGAQFAAPAAEPEPPGDPRIVRATDAALAALEAEARYLLAAYFLDGSTLAQIGKSLRVHESTVSRKLERVLGQLRKQIVKALRQSGMSQRAAEEALELDVRDLAINVRNRLRPPPEGVPAEAEGGAANASDNPAP